jgi:hypothetical protein
VPIEDQVTEVGTPFAFEIPATTVEDPDDGDVLTLQVTFLVGSNGLSLVDQTITGTPVSVGSTAVEVTAVDASGDSAGDTFQVFVLSAGQLPITPRTFWDYQNFTNAVTNLLVSGGSANPDGDDSNNDEEYVYGGDPNSVDAQGISITSDGQGSCVISFLRRTNDPELTYRLQEAMVISGPWRDAPESSFMETSVPLDDEFEQVSIIVPVDLSDPYIYFRILVTR